MKHGLREGGRKRSADWEHLMNIESTIFSLFLTNTHTQIGAGKHVHISKDMYSASEWSQSFSLLWYLLISKSTLTSILTNMTTIVLLWVMLAGFHIISEIITKKMLTIEIQGKNVNFWKTITTEILCMLYVIVLPPNIIPLLSCLRLNTSDQ